MNRSNKIASVGFLLVGLLLLIACGGSRNSGNREDFNQLKKLVSSREFEIEHQWTNSSLGGGSINLIGNTNYIRFEGDSVNIFLPYFGERYAGGGYGSEAGIVYKGLAKNLKVSEKPEDQEIILEFEGQQGSEYLHFYITLFSNNSVSTSVTSTQRESISYRGKIKALAKEKSN